MNYKACRALAMGVLLSGANFCLAEELEEELDKNPDKNPLATFEDMERLLKEHGDDISAQEKYQVQVWMNMFKEPIDFWGQVVDVEGRPIPGAKVHVEVEDDPNMDWEAERHNSEYDLIADAEGKVSLLNQKGAGMEAVATAEGYAPFYNGGMTSLAKADYSGGRNPDTNIIPWPTEKAPRKLVLRKKGPIPQIKYNRTRYLVPASDGTPLKVNIHGGKYLVEVRLWSARPENATFDDYWDWRAVLKPINGQIRRRDKGHPHAAPLKDYAEQFEFGYKASDENWRYSRIGWEAQYWIRWEDGTHAMVNLGVSAGRKKNRVTVESWVNLDKNNSFEDFEKAKYPDRKSP